MHRLGGAALKFMDADSAAEMPLQPFHTHPIGHIAARHEQVSSTAREVGSVEDGLELVDYKAQKVRRLLASIVVIKKLISKLGFWSSGPSCTFQEVFL